MPFNCLIPIPQIANSAHFIEVPRFNSAKVALNLVVFAPIQSTTQKALFTLKAENPSIYKIHLEKNKVQKNYYFIFDQLRKCLIY